MTSNDENQKRATPLHAMRAVLSSFLGVRSKSEYQADITRLTMTQLIVAGVIGAILFVLLLVVLVNFVTR